MRNLLLALLLCLIPLSTAFGAGTPGYAVAISPVPVLNTSDFSSVFGGNDGNSLALDRCGQIRALEFIALPDTTFHIESVIDNSGSSIYQVTTDDYPYPSTSGFFIDSRLVRTTATPPKPRRPRPPNREKVIATMVSASGSSYVWGGNVRSGLPDLLSLYPPATPLKPDSRTAQRWTLKGLDCSGLLYEATDGFTPRNTSTLIRYGEPVPIAGLDADGIAERVTPLDLIVWNGHVIIVIDRERVIESRLDCDAQGGGVVISGLRERLSELLKTRVPLDSWQGGTVNGKKGFVVRRWYHTAAEGK
ncbi:peptidoglycan endopeptidase [bacterium]|nr:peptidoglycan endopeptidase [bacterium]